MWAWLCGWLRRREAEEYEGKVYLVTNYSEYRGTFHEPNYVPVEDSFASKQRRRAWEYFRRFLRRDSFDANVSNEATADEANRLAFLRGSRRSNIIRTTKYSLLSFLPRVMLFQLTRVGNLIFLGVSFLQLIEEISDSNGLPTYLIPLVFVIAVCLGRELASDLARWRSDQEENGRLVRVFRDGRLVQMKQRDIRVGDVVKVHAYEYFPSDLVLLNCCGDNGVCNVETKNVDGESNVKYKHVVPELAALFRNDEDAAKAQIKIVCEPPSDNLNSFSGVAYYSKDDVEDVQERRVSRLQHASSVRGGDLRASLSDIGVAVHEVNLQYDQLLLRGTSMVNTEWAYCVAVYVGKQTRLLKGSMGTSKRKDSQLESVYQRNLFTVLIIMSGCVVASAMLGVYWQLTTSHVHTYLHLAANQSRWRQLFVTMGSMMLLLVAMIPVDLIIMWEIVRMAESKQISWNPQMVSNGKPAVSRSDQLIEDLALITHIYTDKTGTLTQNVMTLRALGFGGREDLARPEWAKCFWERYAAHAPELRKVMREFLLVCGLCHSVVIHQEQGAAGVKDSGGAAQRAEKVLKEVDGVARLVAVEYVPVQYDAASPDELALVNGAARLGCVFSNRRTVTEIEMSLVTEEAQRWMLSAEDFALWEAARAEGLVPAVRFAVREAISFDSNRRCMTVVVEDTRGRLLALCKGADSAIEQKLRSEQVLEVEEVRRQLEEFATVGLRTLVFAVRELPAEFYGAWHAAYSRALRLGSDREKVIAEVVKELECDMQLVGCTGIEDLLQEEVGDVIRDLKEAGIVIWVLTGDKLETALSIGRSTKILNETTCNAVLGDPDPEVVGHELDTHLLNCASAAKMEKNCNASMEKWTTCSSSREDIPTGLQRRQGSAPMFSDFCVTVTGDVLQTVYADEALKERFFRLAQFAGVVIACRTTHKQKFQLTRDNTKFNKHSTSLAIGDGANDVDMILTANVGVGIDGREGRQACRAADFTIGEFRFLRQLLFVHGREALRKNTFLLYFCIFRNFSFSFVNVIYNFYTGFSGVSVFNTWSKQIINLCFTSFPLMLYVILDRELPHSLLTRYPILYNTWSSKPINNLLRSLMRPLRSNWLVDRVRARLGQRRGLYDPFEFWGYILAALWLSLFETLMILTLTNTTDFSYVDGSPLTFGFNLFSQTMYVHHVLAVNAIVCLVTKSWFWPNHVFLWSETLALLAFWLIASLVPTFAFVPEAHVFYGTFECLHTSLTYYGVLLLTLVVTLFPFWGYLYYRTVFNPSLEDRITLELQRGTFAGIQLRRPSVAYVENEAVLARSRLSGFAFAIDQRDALMAAIQRTIHKIFNN